MLILVIMLLGVATPVQAWELGLRLGPAAVGNGGANPISIPPANPIDYEFYYVSKAGWEIDASISPGIFFGWRSAFQSGLYAAAGPGLVINANGSGPGVFASLGYLFTCNFFCVGFEYKQALGLASGGMISPYAVRFGMGFNFQ